MKSKIFKRILYSLLILLASFIVVMLIPRGWSALNPKKAPLGYYYQTPTIIAVITGLESLIDKAPAVPEGVEEIKNIEYKNSNGKSLQIDLYKPKQMSKPAPLLVFIHGGGWKGGQRSDYLVYLTHFAKLGYVTATVSYRFISDSPYPACAEDITDAVEWFFQNSYKYNYDPDRIALIGGSAGSHLAMLAAYGWKKHVVESDTVKTDSISSLKAHHKIKAVVEIYGPVDLTTEYARNHPTVTGLMARPYSEIPELYKEASPITYVDKNSPPTLILQGTADELIPMSQAELLRDKLDSLGIPCVYKPLPGWPHTMDMVQRVNDYFKPTLNDFFEKYLK
ncbi:MAG: alpha/beta hydrolase [Prolixibacteraceae bacterium]|nr:alpha/beta hydrolase [Prolixibacteraceae bacterium]